MNTLTAKEVAAQLVRAVRGEVPIRLTDPRLSWDYVYAGNVEFDIGGWIITIFNDCDSYDYVDTAISPDGRKWEFPEWNMADDPDNPPVESHLVERDEYMPPGTCEELERLLKKAT